MVFLRFKVANKSNQFNRKNASNFLKMNKDENKREKIIICCGQLTNNVSYIQTHSCANFLRIIIDAFNGKQQEKKTTS